MRLITRASIVNAFYKLLDSLDLLSTASPIPGHQNPMEPTDNLSGGGRCRRSGDYGCPAGTFNQLEQEQDLMSSLFLLSESQSPPPSSSPWLSLPPAEGFAAPENFGDGQISPLDEEPCIPAAVAEETYHAAAPAPLVATHGTGAGQFSYNNFSPSSIAFDDLPICFSEEEVQQVMISLMAPDGLWNTTNGGPAATSHADAVPPGVQQGTSTTADEPPHPQQQLPLPLTMNDPEAQPGGGNSFADKELQIQHMTPTVLPPQLPSPTPMINPSPNEANHAASAPMGSQEGILIPAVPQNQAYILSRASTRRRPNKSRGLPSGLQDGPGKLFGMVIDMIRQFGRHIGKMMKDAEHGSIVGQHFWRSYCKYCYTFTVICQYCNTVMRSRGALIITIEMLRHLERFHNNIPLLPASSRESKKTQRSSQALQIKEIAENPNGESEPIQTENSNCATAARVDTQCTNAVVLSPWQQHQPLMDRKEQTATILSSQPCCQGPATQPSVVFTKYFALGEPDSWCDLIIRLSDSSSCSSTTKSTHDGFRLEVSDKKVTGSKLVHVHSSAAWNPYKDHAGVVLLGTFSNTVGSSYLSVGVNDKDWASAPAGCAYPWQCMHLVLCSLGFKEEFATNFVIYALGWLDACNLRLRSPRSSDKHKSIVEQAGDVPSAKRKRKPLPPRSKVWNHFTKEEKAEGSTVTMARCDHCGSKLRADSDHHGTTHLARHIRSTHPDKLAESPL